MLYQSKETLAGASSTERRVAEIVALRLLASELEENLIPVYEAASTAKAHRDANDETWQRTVFGVLLGLREASAQGYQARI